MRKYLKFGAFLPDNTPRGEVLSTAKNVLPTVDGYRPIAGFSSVSSALSGTFLGGFSVTASDGGTYLLAGTSDGLYKYGTGSWTALLSALTITGRWRFVQFGDHVVAVNGGTTYDVNLTAGTAAALAGAPTFVAVAVVGDFVVGAQPNGDILRVRWSAFNDHTGWTIGTNQSGDQPMLTGGEVMGIVGGEYGVIFQRQRLVRMSRTGDSTAPFQFDEISANFGCASKASIAAAGRTAFCWSDRGFIAVDDGQAPRQIGEEKFSRTFRESLAADDYERIWSAIDPANSLVFWGIPGTPGTVWVYNFALDRAATLELSFDGLFSGYESSTTLEGIDTLYPGGIDTVPYSLDDPRFSGGSPRMYLVQAGELGTFAGSNLAARLTQSQFAPAGTQTARLTALWPDTDATEVTCTVDARQRRGDAENPVSSNATMQASGRVPVRANGRYLTITTDIAAGATWTHIDGIEIEGTAAGWRKG